MKKNFINFEDARTFARSLRFKTHFEWYKYNTSGDKPSNIPSNPQTTYKGKGWISWMDWLGNYYPNHWNRVHTVNQDYFQTWSSNMAYILGFWWTDGNIYKNRFNISQNYKTKYLLKEILKELSSDHPITTNSGNKKVHRIDIYCQKIVDDIKKLGGCEKKSLIIGFPDVPKEYLADFIRGLWDGDGSIWEDSFGSFCSNISSGSYEFITRLQSVLKDNINGFKSKIYTRKFNSGYIICKVSCKNHIVTHNLHISQKNTLKLAKFIYRENAENKIKHIRKYNLFLKCIRREYEKEKS